MSVWDEIREMAGKAIVEHKGDLRNVCIFVPHAKEAEMLDPAKDEDPAVARRIRYYGVRGSYDQMYQMLIVYDAPSFCIKSGPSWTKEEKRLVEETYAAREAEYDRIAQLQELKERQAAKRVAEELGRGAGRGGAQGGVVGASH